MVVLAVFRLPGWLARLAFAGAMVEWFVFSPESTEAVVQTELPVPNDNTLQDTVPEMCSIVRHRQSGRKDEIPEILNFRRGVFQVKRFP